MTILSLSWYLGVVGIIIGIAGGIYFILSLRDLGGQMRHGLKFLVFASLLYVLFSSMMVFLGLLEVPITDTRWAFVPILFTISAIAYAIGSNKLVQLFSINSKQKN